MSLTNTNDLRKYQYFPLFDWLRIINPKLYFPITEENLQETIKNEQLALVQIEEAILSNQDKAALSSSKPFKQKVETIISVMNFSRIKKNLRRKRNVAHFDEVQTGIGITGKMWAFQNYSVVPDVISFGKKHRFVVFWQVKPS